MFAFEMPKTPKPKIEAELHLTLKQEEDTEVHSVGASLLLPLYRFVCRSVPPRQFALRSLGIIKVVNSLKRGRGGARESEGRAVGRPTGNGLMGRSERDPTFYPPVVVERVAKSE